MEEGGSQDERGKREAARLRAELPSIELRHVEMINEEFVLLTFGNGVVVRLRSEDVRRLAISSAVEVIPPEEPGG